MAIFNMRNGESANGERRNGERTGESLKRGIFEMGNLQKQESFLIPRLADSPFLVLKRAHKSSRFFFTEEE